MHPSLPHTTLVFTKMCIFHYRYAEVRSPGFLHFYKDKRSADANRVNTITGSNIGNSANVHEVLDLRLVMDFKVHDRKNKDNVGLDLELADETIRLKYVFFSFPRWNNIYLLSGLRLFLS